uniref:Uncharacterized protein n=1 Tax=Naja naja TaxID=35670 RepID=A0A8C6VLG0_NAJNA
MMVIGTILFCFLLPVLLILLFLRQFWIHRHLPPGPLAVPFLGSLLSGGLWLTEDYFLKLAKRYGNTYSFWFGHQLMIVLSGFKSVKEGMTNFPEEFLYRVEAAFLNDLGKGRGIIFSNGHTWKQQRHIGVTSLRKLGLGKKSIEHQIEDAAQTLVEVFRQTKEKVQKEIEDVFGSSGSISFQDRKKLPYTNAVIHEMQRVKYALFYGVPRWSTKDVTMRGYHIPKGSTIVPDLRSVLLDPEQWETPEKFNPNHFLDEDGKFIDREEFLPFGIGKRACVGQQLARIEIFIFLTSLLRAFNFRLPEGVKELNEAPVAKLIMHPHPYKLCAIPTQA